MNIFDVIGPVMVGPSSSHTAGAVKIGRVCHKLLAEKVVRADIFFHGSFLTAFGRRSERGKDFTLWFFSCNRKGAWHR